MTIELDKPLESHAQMLGISLAIFSMVSSVFSGVVVVLYGDVMNPIFRITMMIFVKALRGG